MSKITNDCLTRLGTGCFVAVTMWQQMWHSSKGYEARVGLDMYDLFWDNNKDFSSIWSFARISPLYYCIVEKFLQMKPS